KTPRWHRRTSAIDRPAAGETHAYVVRELEAEEDGFDAVVAARFACQHTKPEIDLRLGQHVRGEAHSDARVAAAPIDPRFSPRRPAYTAPSTVIGMNEATWKSSAQVVATEDVTPYNCRAMVAPYSNGPKKPGADGSATRMTMMPWTMSVAASGT